MPTEPRPLIIGTAAGNIAAVLHPAPAATAATVVCCHGLMSSKDSSKLTRLCEMLAEAGINGLRFDFGGCGESTAKYETSLIQTRWRDLRAVLDFARRLPGHAGPLGLFGSSLGGYLAFLAAAAEAVDTVVTMAAPFDLANVHLEPGEGERYLESLETGAALGQPASLDHIGPGAVRNALIIHGKRDATVPWEEAERLFKRAGSPKELLLFEEAGHQFLDPGYRAEALRATVEWFRPIS